MINGLRSIVAVRTIICSIVIIMLLSNCTDQKPISVSSPTNNLEAEIANTGEGIKLELKSAGEFLFNADLVRFIFAEDSLLNGYKILENKRFSSDETWRPVYGEKSTISDRYNAVEISLAGPEGQKEILKLICRVYDEGLAFRYIFVKEAFHGHTLTEELSIFNLDEEYDAWVTGYTQSQYSKEKIREINVASVYPLVIKRNKDSYFAIGEAVLVDYARTRFVRSPGNPGALQTKLDGEVDLEMAGYSSPWRYVMVAGSAGKLLENNYFILNLNKPCEIEDVSWIKPGKVIREVTLTTRGGKACVDFAVRHNLQYVEFDAGWYGPEYEDSSNATTITLDPGRSPGPLDLHEVIGYADDKDIGIILYVNRRQLERQLDDLLPLYNSWGIKGMKYGFVRYGSQEATSWLHDAVRKAANYQMMVDVHDEYRTTGFTRTYPNLMTVEGIRGDEETPSTEETLITLFTRMIAGSGDNTNCYNAPRVWEKMGGKAAQMAKAVMLYSPWQFLYWYDRPEGSSPDKGGAGSSTGIIKESEDLSFFDALPTVWDDTKVLEGEIGEYATIARKNGKEWFLGSLTANKDRNVNISLEFLEAGNDYQATIYWQDARDLANNDVRIEKLKLNRDSIISKNLIKDAGLAVIFRENAND